MRAGALVAAAGLSARMGFPKLLLAPPGGLPLVVSTCRAFRDAGISDVTVTLPPDRAGLDGVLGLLRAEGVSLVENRHWDAGLIGSVWTVLDGDPGWDALVLTPVDVPGIDGSIVTALTRQHDGTHWIAPAVDGVPGHPVLIPRSLFPWVRGHAAGGGVRAALAGVPGVRLPWGNISVVTSVDTPDAAVRASPALGRWG